MAQSTKMPTAFVPHGGGPWPVMDLPGMDRGEARALSAYMRSIADTATRPNALLVVSAHWETSEATVNTGESPSMLYDYGGFPPEAYRFQWPAPGDPGLAAQVRDLLRDAGFATREDSRRGYDHGTFIPLMLAYPDADIPVVQLSLKRGLDPEEHLAMGRALAPLREQGVYILGSGNSFHNLPAFFRHDPTMAERSQRFDDWLNAAVQAGRSERERLLRDWANAPEARACHPREEHLIPLMVAAGAAEADAGHVAWTGRMGGMRVTAHRFG